MCFRGCFDAGPGTTLEAHDDHRGDRMNARRCRVLFVDDDEQIVRLIAHNLRARTTHAVDTAASAPAALKRLRREPFDVLITDTHIRGVLGTRLAREARDLQPRLRVLLMSADQDELRTAADDAHGTLAKPFTLPRLVNEIVRVLVVQPER